jgi:hypothetical protein
MESVKKANGQVNNASVVSDVQNALGRKCGFGNQTCEINDADATGVREFLLTRFARGTQPSSWFLSDRLPAVNGMRSAVSPNYVWPRVHTWFSTSFLGGRKSRLEVTNAS